MSWEDSSPKNLTGAMLVAHPRLLDPNFRRSILFLSHYSSDDGAIGLILNRPMKKTFGEVAAQKISETFRNMSLFYTADRLQRITLHSPVCNGGPMRSRFRVSWAM